MSEPLILPDQPSSGDFWGEVFAALGVDESGVTIFSAGSGAAIQPGPTTVIEADDGWGLG